MIQFHHTTLPNGLTLLAEADSDAHTAALGFFVRTGARDESPHVMGVSHYLEHMMFKGTARRSADDVNREFDELGANYNAFTSHEQTVYYAQVLPEFLASAADLLGDMLRPALREEDFTLEKNVILEEIGMYDDRPEWRLQDTLLETYFNGHPLGHRVLGTHQTVGDLTAAQMRDYFSQRYSPDNIIVAAAGQVDFDALVSQLTGLTAAWPPTDARREGGDPRPAAVQQRLTDDRVTRHYLAMLAPAPSAQDPQRYAAKVLADMLGDSDGSRLYWNLVDPGLAEEADFSFMPQDGSGAWFAFAACTPGRADAVEAKLLETLDQAASGDVPLEEDEVTRAKNKLATGATLQGERPLGRMMRLGSQWMYLDRYLPLEEDLEALMAVTRHDLRSLLAAYPFQPRTIVRLGRGEGGAA